MQPQPTIVWLFQQLLIKLSLWRPPVLGPDRPPAPPMPSTDPEFTTLEQVRDAATWWHSGNGAGIMTIQAWYSWCKGAPPDTIPAGGGMPA
ncbi:MAG: hypothetical protein EHM42_15945 [Planctomycetaceae bacterium]|nr:MAG: hypothetical protein EHM42_15945 [Planctomycetaceae bacterium]